MKYLQLYIKYLRAGSIGCGYRNCFVKDSGTSFFTVYYPGSDDYAVVDDETVKEAPVVELTAPQARALLEQVETRREASMDNSHKEIYTELIATLTVLLRNAAEPKIRVRTRKLEGEKLIRVRIRPPLPDATKRVRIRPRAKA